MTDRPARFSGGIPSMFRNQTAIRDGLAFLSVCSLAVLLLAPPSGAREGDQADPGPRPTTSRESDDVPPGAPPAARRQAGGEAPDLLDLQSVKRHAASALLS